MLQKIEIWRKLTQVMTGSMFPKIIYNHWHNIFRLLDVLKNFAFTTSGTMRDYYLRVASRVFERIKT